MLITSTPSSSRTRRWIAATSVSPGRGWPQQELDQTPGHVTLLKALLVRRIATIGVAQVHREGAMSRRSRGDVRSPALRAR